MALSSRRPVYSWRTVAQAAVLGNLSFAVLAWGGAVPWSLPPLVGLSCLGLFALLLDQRRRERRLFIPTVSLLLGGAAVLCLIQLLPLPAFLLKLLSPHAAELREFALVPLGFSRHGPVSLDPPATLRELAKHVSYFAVLLTVSNMSDTGHAIRRWFAAVALLGSFIAVAGLTHSLLNISELWGHFPFIHAQPPIITPFGNPNHLAALLTLTATLALGLALTATDRQWMAVWGLLYAGSGLALLLSLSRGGIVFFAAGQLGMVLASLALRKGARASEHLAQPARLKPLMAAGIVAAMVALGAYVSYEPVTTELATANTVEKIQHTKVELWPMMLEASAKFWPLGMGRGAFELGLPRYQTLYAAMTFTHAENIILQLLAEFGLLATLGMVAVGLMALVHRLRLLSSLLDAAALIALCAVFLHELFDFAWELSGCAVASVVVLGALFGRNLRGEEGLGFRWRNNAAFLLAGACLCVGTLAVLSAGPQAREAEERLAAAVEVLPLPALRHLALEEIHAHPADYQLYAMVGAAEVISGDPRDGLAFLERALFLKPQNPSAHRAAAWALRRLGRGGQAILEYRLAVESGAPAESVWQEALPLVRTEDDLQRLWNERMEDAEPLARLLMGSKREADARKILAWAKADAGATGHANLWLMEAELEQQLGNSKAVISQADEARRRGAPSTRVASLTADALRQLGEPEKAFATLEAAVAQNPEDMDAAFALVASYLSEHKPARARELLARIKPYARDRVRYLQIEGATFQAEKRLNRALESYETALRLAPERSDLHYALASIFEALHRNADAAAAVRAGLQAEGPTGKSAADAWLSRLEAVPVPSDNP